MIVRNLQQRRTRSALMLLAAVTMLTALGPSAGRPAQAAGLGCAVNRSLTPDGEETAMLVRINSYRAAAGLATLSQSPALTATAAWKAADLGANGYFAHDDLGRSWSQRFSDCGYGGTPNIAENLAAGNADADSTFEQWRESAGHNANLLNPSMRAIGVGRAYAPGSPYGWYWVAAFGAVVDGAAPPAATSSPVPPPAPPTQGAGAAATPNGLATGATATVSGTGDCLRVHSAARLDSDVVGCLADGSAMVIAAGPVSADGYTWWQLGALGWAVDRYLRPAPQAN